MVRLTYKAVVLAADGVGVALGATAHANNADGGAVKSEEDTRVLEDDADGVEQGGPGHGIGLCDSILERCWLSINL